MVVNHMANIIMAFFGGGKKWNVKIDYSIEDKPLGIIAPLTLLDDLPDNFLVMNGDVFTDLDYADVFWYHMKNKNDITISTYRREMRVDFGELKLDNQRHVVEFKEKPAYNFNGGIAVNILNKKILEKIPQNKVYGFDNLIIDGIKNNLKITAYFSHGLWLDIGRPEDYDKANEMWETVRDRLLPEN